MSSSPSPPTPGQPIRRNASSTESELARTKRKLALLEDKLAQAQGNKRKNASEINQGRCLSRLVSLFNSFDSLIEEADRRFSAEDGDDVDGEAVAEPEVIQRDRDRLYSSYILLLRSVPRIKVLIEDADQEEVMKALVSKLQHGANEARRDDVRRILQELPEWLNEGYAPRRPFSTKDRKDRGLQNDITGMLLCPINYNWSDGSVRADIRNGKTSIAEDYYLTCFYPRGKGNCNDVEHRFLRSQLLVKTFCAIFTSPSSADAFSEEGEEGPIRKKRKSEAQKKVTKSTVADLIGMEGKVTPRSIAHAAVMLAFNLSDCDSWRTSYNSFSYHGLYNYIVDFFEDVDDPITQRKVDQLLLWWNQQVFPEHTAVVAVSQKSSNKLKEQRAQRAAAAAHRI